MSTTRSKSRARKMMAVSAALYEINLEDCDTERGAELLCRLLRKSGYRITKIKNSAGAGVAEVVGGVEARGGLR